MWSTWWCGVYESRPSRRQYPQQVPARFATRRRTDFATVTADCYGGRELFGHDHQVFELQEVFELSYFFAGYELAK